MGDSKPIDIVENYQSLNYEQNSLSAYASAESSPTQTDEIKVQDNNNIDIRLCDEPYLNCPKSDVSSEINTYWGLPPASSLLIDEEDKLDALEHSREKLSQSKSFHDSKEIDRVENDKEYQSLPVQPSKPLIDDKVDEKKTYDKRELSESDLFKLNVVDGEEDLVKVDLKEGAASKTDQLPEMSVPKSKTSKMTSFIEKIFSSKLKTETEPKTEKKVEKTEEYQTKTTLSATLSSAAASASSPNPECSPYKFLISESSDKKTVNSLKLDNNETKKEAVVEKLIEDLASLNHKDSEKHDPILSGISPNKKDDLKNKKIKSEKKASKPKSSKSPAKTSTLPTKKTDQTKVDQIPASSREFCMNLNFNLASAAAATAGGPVVVVDNSNKSPVAKEHNKFTSNASTSSIHNDLKMILEESKDEKKSSGKENKKLNKSNDGSKKDKPKPQRQKKESKNNSKNNTSNTSFNSSMAETTSNSMTVETGNLSPTSKTNNLNLIKMMMLMDENNNSKKDGKITLNKHMEHERNIEQPSIIDLVKQNGRYKYTREFLMQIREQRSSFIDQIHPEIFKAYCYCMNGKYWDPEKYFDIVQFPGDYERINQRNQYNRSSSYNKSAGSKYTKKNTPNSTFNNNYKHSYSGSTPTTVPNFSHDDSPQPLQVPKNSPKFVDHKNKESSVHQIFESLGLNTDHMDKTKLDADKILLGLIKKDKKQSEKSSNIMEYINKKPSHSANVLDNLLPKQVESTTSSTQKHYPLILTAQELEMSQLNNDKLSKYKLPNEISMNKLEELQQSIESNDSVAYKQLVKNLSNHPLNSVTALNNKLDASLTKLQNKQKLEKYQQQLGNTKPSWQISNDGTNMLKQLLNLDKTAKPKKIKSKSSHLSMSHGSASGSSSTGSSPVDSSNNFPSVNPHEKPFENFVAEENRKKIEQAVTVSLNQVLNKSPIAMKQTSPTPKSPIEDLFKKMNFQQKENDLKHTQNEHFNSLLNKMNNPQPKKNDSDILKWFSDVQKMPLTKMNSLSEIELNLQMHGRQESAINKLY